MIVNGACKNKDYQHFENILKDEFVGKDVQLENEVDYCLIAIQGMNTSNGGSNF
jgi:glycine cleavage system aminomethyltransferase T